MADTETPTTLPKRTLGEAILISTRHFVGVSLALLLTPQVVFGPERLETWIAEILVCCGGGVVVAGLAALFWTRTQSAKALENFVLTSWVFAELLLAGLWTETYKARMSGARIATVPAPSDGQFDPTTARPSGNQPRQSGQSISLSGPEAPSKARQLLTSNVPAMYSRNAEQLHAMAGYVVEQWPYLASAAGQETLARIVAERDRLIASGETPSDALFLAARMLAPSRQP